MREIKFRAKELATREWVIGSLAPQGGEVSLGVFFSNISVGRFDIKTLGQFTGPKDKNGVEGHFDDLVRWGKSVYKIAWNLDEGIACLQYVSGLKVFGVLPIKSLRKGEVIGNIHENPELLGVNK